MNTSLVIHVFQVDSAQSVTRSVCEVRNSEGHLLATLHSLSFWALPRKLKTYLHTQKEPTGSFPEVAISFDNPYPFRIRMVNGSKPELINPVNDSLQFSFWLEFRRIRVRKKQAAPVNQ